MTLANTPSSEELSSEPSSANVSTSSAYSSPPGDEVQRIPSSNPSAGAVATSVSVIATSPLVCSGGLDSGYAEASSSADSTQAQGDTRSPGSSPAGSSVIKERCVSW